MSGHKQWPEWHQRNIAVVDGNAAGRRGLEELLALQPVFRLCASVSSAEDFWGLPVGLLWHLNELLVHTTSLSCGHLDGRLFLRQVRALLPGIRVRELTVGSNECGALDYSAPLSALYRGLSLHETEWQAQVVTPLTAGEWRVLTGVICGQSIGVQARSTGRSVKTLYAQSYTGMRKLGVRRLAELLTEKGPG